MNALRLQHLEGRRRQNAVSGGCGQLGRCLPDNIDSHRPVLLAKFKEAVRLGPSAVAPGGIAAGVAVTGAAASMLHVPCTWAAASARPTPPSPARRRAKSSDFLLLEAPIDRRHTHTIAHCRGHVIVERDPARIRALALQSDIVQLAYSGRPLLERYAPFGSCARRQRCLLVPRSSGLLRTRHAGIPVSRSVGAHQRYFAAGRASGQFATGLPLSTVASALPACGSTRGQPGESLRSPTSARSTSGSCIAASSTPSTPSMTARMMT